MTASVPAVSPPTTAAIEVAAAPPSGRLAVMAAYAMAASSIPVPFVPDRLLTRVRGAIAQDVASRHGLSLTTDARAILATPTHDDGAKMLLRTAARVASRRLLKGLAPLAAIESVVRGFEVFALGHLLERYAVTVRPQGAVRVDVDEATKVRSLIDRAMLRALSPALRPTPSTMDQGLDDLRDEVTCSSATPSRCARRAPCASTSTRPPR